MRAWGSTISTPNSNRACRRVESSKRSLSYDTKNCTLLNTAQSTTRLSFASRHNPREKDTSTMIARCIRRFISWVAACGVYEYFRIRLGRDRTAWTSSTISCDNTRTNRPSSQSESRLLARSPRPNQCTKKDIHVERYTVNAPSAFRLVHVLPLPALHQDPAPLHPLVCLQRHRGSG